MTDGPGYPPQHLVRDLSLPRRVGHLVAGFGGLAMAVLIAVLWATEPGTPPARTRLAFAAMIVVGLAGAGLAGWALARRPLFAADRVIAAGLALTASTVVTVVTVVITVAQGSTRGLLAAVALGLALIGAAGVALARARAHRGELLARRRELEHRPDPALRPRAEGREAHPTPGKAAGGRRPLPVGPLALALRHLSAGGRVSVLATVLAAGLIAGAVLLLR